MTEDVDQHPYSLTTEMIATWLLSKQSETADIEVTMADLRENQLHIPTVAADFDSQEAIGRISAWVSGEFDFLVLRRANGTDAFLKHATVTELGTPELEGVFRDFIRKMLNPSEASQDLDYTQPPEP